MRPLVLTLLLATLVVALPSALAAEATADACAPVLQAYACPWGTTGVQDARVCGKSVGSVCVPIL